jgi:hypothetical protein
VLLIGATALAALVILRRTTPPEGRKFAAWVLVGLAVYEVGLVLLFYSRLVCGILVAIGLAIIASQGTPRRPAVGLMALAAPGLLAAAAFEVLPEPEALLVYFSLMLPLLFAVAVGLAVTPWIRWSADARTLASAMALILLAALTPASSFAFTFLRHYEIFHLPVLVAALAGLYWFVRSGMPTAEAEHDRTLNQRTPGERAARASLHVSVAAVAVVVGALVAATMLYQAPLSGVAGAVAWVLLSASVVSALASLVWPGRRLVAGLPLAALAGIFASLMGVRAGAEAFQRFGGGPAPESVYFYIAGAGIAAMALGGALGLAAWREAVTVRRNASAPANSAHPADSPRLPSSDLVAVSVDVPTPAALQSLRQRVRREGARGGILVVAAPVHPLEGLPEAVAAWLAGQHGVPRMHVAVREGREVSYVPPLDADEVH